MFRIDDPTAAAELPTPESAGTQGYFTGGNPSTGVPATRVRASWLNLVQELLRGVLDNVGLAASKTGYGQLAQAIRRLCGGNATSLSANTTLTADHAGLVTVSAASGSRTITLPSAVAANGRPLRITLVRSDSTSANAVTVQRAGTDLVDGATSLSLAVGERVTLVSDGVSTWTVAARVLTGPASFPAGSAAAPGLYVTGDVNTGLAQIGGANTLSMVANGVERLRATGTGVDIEGTASADSLSVSGAASAASLTLAGAAAVDSLSVTAGITARGISVTHTIINAQFTSTSGPSGVEIGAPAGQIAHLDLKVPGSDDYDLRLATTNTGSEILGAMNVVKAMINYDGINNIIRRSYNISSVTDNGSGDYTLNFATALSDSNYAVSLGWTDSGSAQQPAKIIGVGGYAGAPLLMTASAVRIGGTGAGEFNVITAIIV
jgi:hypothetical protein